VRVRSWHYRGLLGSARPADPDRITVADHVADALAVLDAPIDSIANTHSADNTASSDAPAVVIGWSLGALVALELACQHPERVSGLLLVSGAGADLFGGMLGALGLLDTVGVTAPARRAFALGATQLVRAAGPLLNAVAARVPVNRTTANLIRHSGLMRPACATEDVRRAASAFLGHDWGWYSTLALAVAEAEEPELARLRVPLTVLTGQYDLLADPRHVLGSVAALPQARLRVLPTSHFIPLEAPDVLAEELRALVERAEAVSAAMSMARPIAASTPLTTRSRRPA
jgi:pimeloyl-ACP methyl ester carboxylesterase